MNHSLAMSFFIYSVCLFGLAYIVGASQISFHMRKFLRQGNFITNWFVDMLECPACFGFHFGWMLALISLIDHQADLKIGSDLWSDPIFRSPLMTLYASGSNALLGHLTGLMKNE